MNLSIGKWRISDKADLAENLSNPKVLYSRTQLVAVFDDANVLELRLRVQLIGNEKR